MENSFRDRDGRGLNLTMGVFNQPIKKQLERTCPRCKLRSLNWAALYEGGHGQKNRIKITCWNCGHYWWGQYRKKDWNNVK